MELAANSISKSIRGRAILSDVSLCLKSGNIYGFVGKNGSGKTMLFRALSGLMRIDSGSVVWEGKTLHKDFSVLPSLGIIIENAGLYPNFTGAQNLTYLAGLTKRIGKEKIIDALSRVGLDPYDKRLYGKYSLGMKRRLAVAQAIMESPNVIMLDEPTNALDETGVEEIRQIILEEKERGALILLASHNKEDIHLLADELYRVEKGHVVRMEETL
ncbi:ATP-binding cassette domain-containing protein [Lachnospiraceae bacterium WCA-9-b2]|jgi:ABC-2 type transport system ATP-binding protein|uniref:ATP-binding cassette domain-containing protein n=1 Tax=Sporofaciens musculi TaxID=2681861 RepID=A0A7X3SL78_9FIRM|nr:ABC transporter ATP-binding protein [Sporofaciens musculi]MXP78358.1 ATP-binding cassette domain-containing protein [Sporofaciens musculi]GFI18142.1 ABC transporter ATP-binding protein NatA [Lachnospiraceae bacterium]